MRLTLCFLMVALLLTGCGTSIYQNKYIPVDEVKSDIGYQDQILPIVRGQLSADSLSYDYSDSNYDIHVNYDPKSYTLKYDISNNREDDISYEIGTVAINGLCRPRLVENSKVYSKTSCSSKMNLEAYKSVYNDPFFRLDEIVSIDFFIVITDSSGTKLMISIDDLIGPTPSIEPKGTIIYSDEYVDIYVYMDGKTWSNLDFYAYNKSDYYLYINLSDRIVNGKTMSTNVTYADKDILLLPKSSGDTRINQISSYFEKELSSEGIDNIDTFRGKFFISAFYETYRFYYTEMLNIIE